MRTPVTTRRRSRSVLLLSGALAVALVGTACGGDKGATDSGNSSGAGAGGKAGGNLVWGITADPNTLFPWKATQFQAVAVLGLVYDTLTELDKDLNVKPGLADKWAYSDGNKVATFTLKDGQKFADGSPVTSADVKYSLDTIKAESTGAVARTTLASVTSVEAPDPTTVKLTLSAPDAGLVAGLATVNLAIVKKDATEKDLSTTANGSGSFRLDSRKPGQSLTLKANKDYRAGAPKLDGVEVRIIPDQQSLVAALQSGDVHFANLDDPVVAKQAQSGQVTMAKTPQLSYHVLQLKASAAPLDDVNLRLAIACAVDRKQVVDTAAGGEGEVTGPITSPAYKSDPGARPCPTKDIGKAKDYLAKSKSSTGTKLKTIVSQGEYATSVNEAQNLKAQLKEINVDLDLQVMESGAYVKAWVAGDFQAAVALNGGRPDPDAMYGRYWPSTGNLNKVAGFSSPKLDELFKKGKETTEAADRKKIYADISRELEDQAPWVWLFTGYVYTASNVKVQGYTPMSTGSVQFLRQASLG